MADPTNDAQPADSDPVKGAAAELRALKTYLKNTGGLNLIYALINGSNTEKFQVLGGTDANDVPNLAQFTFTGNADAGQMLFPGGFRLKWGKVLLATGTQNAVGTVNFPAAFQGFCIFVGGFPDAPAQAAGWIPMATIIKNVGLNSFDYMVDTSGGSGQPITNVTNLKWLAFGN